MRTSPGAEQGVWARVLEMVQSLTHQRGELDWVASIDSTILRVHQHGAPLPRSTGGGKSNYKKFGAEPADHAIGGSPGGLTAKIHLASDGRGGPLGFELTGGQIADTSLIALVPQRDSRSRGERQAAIAPATGDR